MKIFHLSHLIKSFFTKWRQFQEHSLSHLSQQFMLVRTVSLEGLLPFPRPLDTLLCLDSEQLSLSSLPFLFTLRASIQESQACRPRSSSKFQCGCACTCRVNIHHLHCHSIDDIKGLHIRWDWDWDQGRHLALIVVTDMKSSSHLLPQQHCWTFSKDRSYCIRYCFSVDLGSYPSPVFQRCLAIWSFWTFLVCIWSYHSGSSFRCTRYFSQEGCPICTYLL